MIFSMFTNTLTYKSSDQWNIQKQIPAYGKSSHNYSFHVHVEKRLENMLIKLCTVLSITKLTEKFKRESIHGQCFYHIYWRNAFFRSLKKK